MQEQSLYDNKYEFVKELGSGHFGRVFLAKEEISNRFVAIKQLKNTSKQLQNDIINEIKAVSKFHHPNVVTYLHHFFQDGLLFLVMEYCASGSLRDALRNKKVNSVNSLQWVMELALALQAVHEKGIVHHDIKPDNILFSENGRIKISDFGLANKDGGTYSYCSPETFNKDEVTTKDPRVDIYALGVTLMELLTGSNPFTGKFIDDILAQHDKKDFPIKKLHNWQQEIILKSINKVPELRFQSMKDFAESIQAKNVPFILNKDSLDSGELAWKINKFLTQKKWMRAKTSLEFGYERYPNEVNIIHAYGKYCLLNQNIKSAKAHYEKALSYNPRLDVQKDLGWINLAEKNYPTAISLLSDHLHRNPTDLEAYNLLLQCFYETERYEAGIQLAKTLLGIHNTNECFQNNFYLCQVMHAITELSASKIETQINRNAFLDYNYKLVNESLHTHNRIEKPTLKSKLLYMDYRFQKSEPGKLYFPESNTKVDKMDKKIITFGREGYTVNDIEVRGVSAVSRRHCLIVNCKNDVWLYDLDSTGTFINEKKIIGKAPLINLNTIRINKSEFKVTTDRTKMF